MVYKKLLDVGKKVVKKISAKTASLKVDPNSRINKSKESDNINSHSKKNFKF
jgi:hypothetical protein